MRISGKDLSAGMKADMAREVALLKEIYGRAPHLAVILVGEDPGSVSYVRGKAKACEVVGITNSTIRLDASVSQQELLSLIERLNADPVVDGILVQLPLPPHIDKNTVIQAISVGKDVDGFHPENVSRLWQGRPCMIPCTPKGIMKLLRQTQEDLSGKTAVVVGRSGIVGLPVAKLLLDANATVTVAHSRTADLGAVTRSADILVVAVGHPHTISADMVKPGAVVIDVGVNRDPQTGKLCGDVDTEDVEAVCGHITPVPGGVGPMTIACLMENTIEAFRNRI